MSYVKLSVMSVPFFSIMSKWYLFYLP